MRIGRDKKCINLSSYIILLLALGIGIYIRLYPIKRNPSKQNFNLARVTVYINLRKSIEKKVSQIYPNLSFPQKEKVVDILFKNILVRDKDNIERTIHQLWEEGNKKFSKFYLLGSDSYYYLYLTERIVKEGLCPFPIKGGKYFDKLTMAPLGHWRTIEAHPYVGFLIHKFFSLFNKDIPLATSTSMVPLLIYGLSLIIFLRLCLLLKISEVSTFISSIFFSLSPIFIQRSSWGWYDTDPYNILFPLGSLFLLFKVLTSQSSLLKCRGSFLAICGLSVLNSLYALFWQGWIYLPLFVILSFILLIFSPGNSKEKKKTLIKKFLVYISFTTFSLFLILSPQGFVNSLNEVSKIVTNFFFLKTTSWPDIFLTVGELRSPSWIKLIHIIGGPIFFSLLIIGLGSLLVNKPVKVRQEQRLIILLFFFLLLLMGKSAQRFILFLLVPVSILLALGIETVNWFLAWLNFKLNLFPPKFSYVITKCILMTFLLSPLIYGHISASDQRPMFNRVWEESLNYIAKNTPPNSIINTWWPPGHFIKAIGKRGVVFDGATLNTPQAYWMAQFFLSNSEEEALGILRMLNTSGNKPVEFLLKNDIPLDKAVKILKEILPLSKKRAKQILHIYLSPEKVNRLLSLTHSFPPPAYCLIYNGLVKNTLGLYFVAKWDFKKAKELKEKRRQLLKKGIFLWRGSKDNISFMWSIAGGAIYIGEESYQVGKNKQLIFFANGVTVNLALKQVWINKLEGKISGIPESLLYIEQGKLKEKKQSNPTLKLSILLLPQPDNSYSCIVAPRQILTSLLFRLYYLQALGLSHFEKIIQKEDPRVDTKIILYKINWPSS